MTLIDRPAAALLRLPGNLRAMLWMAASGFLFTVLNVIMKYLSHQLDPWLVAFLRYFFGFVVFLPIVGRLGLLAMRSAAPGRQALRGLFHMIGLTLWFYALPLVSMSEMTAIGFTGPIWICLGAALLLGERISLARWGGVLAGFAGVLIVVHPWSGGGFDSIGLGTVLLLIAAPAFAGSFLLAKVLTRYDRTDVIVLWQHGTVALFSLPLAVVYWTMPDAIQWGWLVICGFLGAGGHYCVTRAYRAADVSVVQSVRFLDLVWASLGGVLVFAQWPDVWTVAGGTMIFAATLWLARREARAPRAAAVAATQAAPPTAAAAAAARS
jgi:drug/metabolite transporter (DMT)-like permease